MLLTLALVFVAGPGLALASGGGDDAYVCSGGTIPAGSYDSIAVTGVCSMPSGIVWIHDNLTIAPGALLDAVTPGDPASNPQLPATVDIAGNVWVGKGAVLLLGCSPNIACPEAITHDWIGGDLTARGAQAVVIHSVTVEGDLSILAGGYNVAPQNQCSTQPNPWAQDPSLSGQNFTPVYDDVEDASVGGDLTIVDVSTCWLGALRNQVEGDVTFSHNTFASPDAMETTANLVDGDLSCHGNSPNVQFGEGGAPNIVDGRASGECGFTVTLPNPAPEAGQGPGVTEPVSVRADSLHTSFGKHLITVDNTAPIATTTAGTTLLFSPNSTATLSGSGLTGNVVTETVEVTAAPDGSSQFAGEDDCMCSYAGQSGAVVIRFYGSTSAHGHTTGTFIIASNGANLPGNLQTLAGWGTFSGTAQNPNTLRLVEHLKIT